MLTHQMPACHLITRQTYPMYLLKCSAVVGYKAFFFHHSNFPLLLGGQHLNLLPFYTTAVNIPLALNSMSPLLNFSFLVSSTGTCPFGLIALRDMHLFSWSLRPSKRKGLGKKNCTLSNKKIKWLEIS